MEPMTADRWRKVEDLYHAALERADSARPAFLEEACAGDLELRREVESLLAQDTGALVLNQGLGDIARDMLSPARRFTPGAMIGPYRVVERLGAGGMGEVYRATDTRLSRDVALKVLASGSLADPERKRRFLSEARAVSALNHPNIVTFYDLLSDCGEDVLLLEYVPGTTLDRLIGKRGLRLREALEYAIQIADGLAGAHQAGIVHRDLKPSNIIVSQSGTVKILDFGLAKFVSQEPARERTQTMETAEGRILGTVAYMSPEQADGRAVDARSDIFSFGVVLHEMLTGRKVFQRATSTSTLAAILSEEPAPVEGVPESLRTLLGRCLRKPVARRAQSMADIKVALEDIREESERPEADSRPRGRSKLLWSSGVVLLLLVAAVVFWAVLGNRTSPATLRVEPLTTYPGIEAFPSFSPDGNQVAFSWNGEKQDNVDIYVKLIGAGLPLRLTSDPADDLAPKWSPDGASIAFLRKLPASKVAVMLISPLGGPERKVAELSDVSPLMWEHPSLDWTPDAKHLAVQDGPLDGSHVALYLLSLDTGEKQRLTQPPPKIPGDSTPAFSPDGRMLAFTRQTGIAVSDLYVVPLSGTFIPQGEPRRITFENRRSNHPAWMPGGRELVFYSNRDGGDGLWRVAADGGSPPRRLPLGEGGYNPEISRRGSRLVFGRAWDDDNIWKIDLPETHSRSASTLKSSLFIASSRIDRSVRVSPDGKRFAFVSTRSGYQEIWVSESYGRNAVQLTTLRSYTGTPSWSPDGQRVSFDCNMTGHVEVYVVNAGGGRPKQITSGNSDNAMPTWSHDGKWIYFGSVRSGERQIWKMPSAGGEAIQVTRRGGYFPLESPDGAYLFYTKDDPVGAVWKMPLPAGEEARIMDSVKQRAFVPVHDGIYFLAPAPSRKATLRFYAFASGQTSMLGTIEKPTLLYLDASPDGRSLFYSQEDQTAADLMLVENFH
jgi:Tol biopolymer transport system component